MKNAAGSIRILFVITVFACLVFGTTAIAETKSSQSTVEQGIDNPVNINTATEKDLSALPGIGKKRAAAIVAYRTANGKFSSIEDFKKVEGIGKKTLEKLKGRIVME